MKRSVIRRSTVVVACALGVAVFAAGMWLWLAKLSVGSVEVTVTGVRVKDSRHDSHAPGALHARGRSPREATDHSSATPSESDTGTGEPYEVLDGRAFAKELGDKYELDDEKRESLERYVKLVASMQERVERHVDSETRERMHAQVLHQFAQRLRLVLGPERARDPVARLSEMRPMVTYE